MDGYNGINSTNETVTLFFDVLDFEYYESCESFAFEFEFDENITFYEDDGYSTDSLISSTNPLFVTNLGDQQLYVEIDIGSSASISDLTEANIIDMSIINVWFCVYDSNDTNLTGSCFDGGSSGVEIWYLYSTTGGTTNDGYMTSDDIISDSNDNLMEQFSFYLPTVSNTDANRFGVQIGIELSMVNSDTTTVRRLQLRTRTRTLLDGEESAYSYIKQSYKSNSMTSSESDDDSSNRGSDNPFGDNAMLYYIIFAGCGLLVAALCVIVYLSCQRKKSEITLSRHMESVEIGAARKQTKKDQQLQGKQAATQPDGADNYNMHMKVGVIDVDVAPYVEGEIITTGESIPF